VEAKYIKNHGSAQKNGAEGTSNKTLHQK